MKVGLPERKFERHFTYGDYRDWPDDERWELIDGVAWNMCAAPNLNHQASCGALFTHIYNYLVGKPCRVFIAPTDVLLPEYPDQPEDEVDTVLEPDILVVCDQAKLGKNYVRGAPDWVIEILSPSTSRKDQRDKFDRYERAGVREYWLVNPANKSVHAFRLDAETRKYGEADIRVGGGRMASLVLPELTMELDPVFAEL